jgi:hypothetical protein
MNSPPPSQDLNQPDQEPSLPEKLANAQAEQMKWSQVATNPNLSPEAALVARNAARSYAVAARLYQGAQKPAPDPYLETLLGLKSQPQDQQNSSPGQTDGSSTSPETSD